MKVLKRLNVLSAKQKISDQQKMENLKRRKKIFKKFKNFLSGSTFSVIDIDIATAKYIGILEDAQGRTFNKMMSPAELETSNYHEV